MGTIVTAVAPGSLAAEDVLDLYASVGWTAYTRDRESLVRALAGSHAVVAAHDDGGRLVGLARSVSDGETIVYLQDVLVRPEAQRSGIGARLVTVLLDAYAHVRQHVLLTDAEANQRAFYESLGFAEVHDMEPGLRAFVRLTS